ncbi:MAG TPA: glycosyltransferase [Terrimesophilobacter sp.]|nr:glycosyltransferase [Terrimesophilobacter sp.]
MNSSARRPYRPGDDSAVAHPEDMRVLLFAESFLPHMNGVTNSLLHSLAHLQRRGDEAVVIAPHFESLQPLPSSVHGASVVRMPSIPAPGYPQVRVAAAGMRRLGAVFRQFRPDVVHLASPFVLGWQGLKAAERAGVPTVAVYQTDLPGYAARYGVPGAQQLLTSHLARLHGRASVNLAPSSAALADLERIGVPRLALWGRGVDTERFRPSRRNDARRAELAPEGEVVIGYVGRLAPEKQVEDLAVLADLPGVRVVIVGDGPSRPELEALMPGARFLGFRGGEELAEIVAGFDIFVHPGEHETFCQTVQEALASGVPVVATGRGGPVDLVQSSRTGWLYRPGDLADLRARVADLAGDAAKRAAFASAAVASVEGRSWRAVCEELVGHYEAAIGDAATGNAATGMETIEAAAIGTAAVRASAVRASASTANQVAETASLQAPAWSSYVALGDSLTEGLCDTSRQPEGEFRGWADRLATLLAHTREDSHLEYANLAVRSKRIAEVMDGQLPAAIRLRPELVSVLVGANDLVRLRAAPIALADRVGAGVACLAATGATVLVVGVFAPPYAGLGGLHSRMRRFNERLHRHCEVHGALFVDFAEDPILADRSSWAADRVHLSSRGHRALCYRVAEVLGIPGATEIGALDRVVHEDSPPPFEERLPALRWMWRHARPWMIRRIRGRRAGDGMQAKHAGTVAIVGRMVGRAGAPEQASAQDRKEAH